MNLVLTCEHGGNAIPTKYQPLFEQSEDILNSHRGYDWGALDTFKYLKPLSSFSNFSETSRLLIELNRSLHHNHLFSEYSKSLSKSEKEQLINSYYSIYRQAIQKTIKNKIEKGQRILHISVHSFTPCINGSTRHADIGLLYDPSRTAESVLCKQLKQKLITENSTLKVRYNYPYLGKSDGFTTFLRKTFPENYLGIELEINQKFTSNNIMCSKIKKNLYCALDYLLIK